MKNRVETIAQNDVWADLYTDPAEAATYRLRYQMMNNLRAHITELGLKQKEAAELLGVKQPRVSELMTGRFNEFTLEALLQLSIRAGLSRPLIAYPKAKKAARPKTAQPKAELETA